VPRLATSAVLLALAVVDGTAQNTIHRDWISYPAVVQVDTGGDIYAIGDVHGDSERLIKLLTAARIIEGHRESAAVNWIAGNAVVVFLGDMIDKGPHSLGAIQLIRALRDAAVKSGGQVVILMGNHEAEFLANPDTDKTKEFTDDLKRASLNPKDVAACRGDLGEFLCRMPFAARVGDWFFSHAGNSDGRTMERLISDLQTGVDRDGFRTAQLLDGTRCSTRGSVTTARAASLGSRQRVRSAAESNCSATMPLPWECLTSWKAIFMAMFVSWTARVARLAKCFKGMAGFSSSTRA